MAGATHAARTGFAAALFALPRSDRDERRLDAAAMDHLDRLGIAELRRRAARDRCRSRCRSGSRWLAR